MRVLPRVTVAAALAAGILTGPPAAAGGPTFAWDSPQAEARAVPAPAPFLLFARFGPNEDLQRFYFSLAAGATESLSVLVPAGAPPVELTVIAPDGSEFSLPSLPQSTRVWLGPIALDNLITYPYIAQAGAGTYILATQPGASGEPYAIAGNWGGGNPLGPYSLGALLLAPVTWLRTLLWLWG
jgi:hypothetical protein